jgi:hypothetical protein
LLRRFDLSIRLARRGHRIEPGRLVQQQGDGAELQQAGVGVNLDPLVRDPEHGLFHHLPVHADPAAFNVLFGLAARAGHHFSDALGQALTLARRMGNRFFSVNHCGMLTVPAALPA